MYSVDELRSILAPIAKHCGLNRLSVFGSVARGEASVDSDVDLLVDVPNGWGLLRSETYGNTAQYGMCYGE